MLSIKGLSFSYVEGRKVLDNVNLELDKGLFCLVGPSGCGKSTLCLTLNGLIPHSISGKIEGKVIVNGKGTQKYPVNKLATNVGMVFQNPESQLFSLSAEDEIAFGPCNLGLPWGEVEKRVLETLKLLDIEHLRNKSPEEMSSGEKQKVAIASALSMKPKILVLDEPTANLDPISSEEIFRIAKNLSKNILVFLAEHDLDRVMRYADKVAVMDKGRIVLVGKPGDVLNRNEFQNYLDFPKAAQIADRLNIHPLPVKIEALSGKLKLKRRLPNERRIPRGKLLIEARNLEFGYEKGKPVLKSVNLKIYKGEFLAVVGGNGAGKSTLVSHFNGLLRPDKGDVLVAGLNTKKRDISRLSRKVGYVFQNPDLQLFEDTIFDEVAFGPRNLKLSGPEVSRRVERSLRAVGLWELRGEDPFSLSLGQKRRVTIASVLSMKPELIIVDEPSTGLDPRTSKGVMGLVRELNRKGRTIILVTHDMELVGEYAKRCIVMDKGKIIADGSAREIFSQEDLIERANLMRPEISNLGKLLGEPRMATVEDCLRCVL